MLIVTGGAGFIGSNLLAGLEAHDMGPLIVVDTLGTGDKWRNIAKRSLHDVIEPRALPRFLEVHSASIAGIFHIGAVSDTTCTDADAIVESNIRCSLDLWDWCAAHRVPLIYASSAATYGDGSKGFHDAQTNEELAQLRPMNLYGWSKHLVDRKVLSIATAGGRTPPVWAGFKFFNVYGPNEYHKGAMRSVVLQVFEQIGRGEPARLFRSAHAEYADGGQLRDFVWVDDVVNAMIWIFKDGHQSGIFNLGSGKARSFADVARAVFAALGKRPQIEFVDMPEELKGRYQYFTEARMNRLQAAGWRRDATLLEDGVRQYVCDYLATTDRYV